MSVVPLRLSDDPKASSKPHDVRGTVNIPYGYRLSHHRQTRHNVNLTRGKRLSEGNKLLRTEHPEEKGKFATAKYSLKEEKGRLVRAQDSTKEKEGQLTSAKDSTKEETGKLPSAKVSSKVEKEISIVPGDPKASINENKAKKAREFNTFLRTYEFVERTDKKIRKKKIINFVDEGIAEYEKSIDVRRSKLRSMILAEEKLLTREIIDQAQRGADARIDEIRNRTEELRNRLEEQRLATVTEKRMRQYLAQCPEARDKFARKTILETKYSNLVQMAEKDAKRQAEKEIDVLWYELMLKEVEAMKAREVEEEKRRAVSGKSIVATLEKQIAGKLAMAEEEKRVKEEEREYLARVWDIVRKEKMSYLDREKDKRDRLKRDIEEQLLRAKRCLVERAREEEAMERSFRILGEAELAREKAATKEATSNLRNEIVAYMKSLEEVRVADARRNAEIEAIVEASARKVAAERDAIKQKLREDRERKLREVLEGREEQIRLKRATTEEENKRAAYEDELRRKETGAQAALEAEAEMRKREIALRYGQELKAQQKLAEEMRRCKNEEAERMHREDLERNKEYEKLTEQLLNAPEIITPHAFKILLKECAARREAEQKGLCYCPRLSHQQPE